MRDDVEAATAENATASAVTDLPAMSSWHASPADVSRWCEGLRYSGSTAESPLFPVLGVLAHWRKWGRAAVASEWVDVIDEAATALDNPSGTPVHRLPGPAWLAAWLPMLVDVHHDRCRYATYVGTDLLGRIVTQASDRGASPVSWLLATLLEFESSDDDQCASAPLQPPSDELRRRRTRAVAEALRRWVPTEQMAHDEAGLVAAAVTSCAPGDRLALECALVPITRIHDEVLFIRVLQIFEAVFLAVYEQLIEGREQLRTASPDRAAQAFARAASVLDRSFPVFRVLATIRPASFAEIRMQTTGASGLQSEMFKRIEALGAAPEPSRATSDAFAAPEVAPALTGEEPSIQRLLGGNRSLRGNAQVIDALEAMNRAWLRWKRTHWAVASRVIGSSAGTGGTSGTPYLRAHMLTPLVPRLPQLGGKVGTQVSLASLARPSPMVAHLHRALGVISVGEGEPIVIPAPRRRLGDFKWDVRGTAAPGVKAGKDACSQAAERATQIEGIERAVGVPPNVYLTPSLSTLEHVVVSAVSAAGAEVGRRRAITPKVVQVQYGCPNLNKALHLGHLRNIFVGAALANLVEAAGHRAIRVDQPSNRGKHIAKAVLAYERWGSGTTPATRQLKPDHFVQEHYVEYGRRRDAADGDHLDRELAEMVRRLEAADEPAVMLAERLTRWAYEGIEQTYARIGVRFDAVFAEGDTLTLAEDEIRARAGVAQQRSDASVFVDLSGRGLREVTLLRQDGSPLLHAQFLGACLRREELAPDTTLLFVMGDEYRHTVPELLGVLELLGHEALASRIEAVHHGMVRAGGAKLSSRDGTTQTADGFLDDLRDTIAAEWEADHGERLGFNERKACEQVAIAVAKYAFLSARRDRPVDLGPDLLASARERLDAVRRWAVSVGEDVPPRAARPSELRSALLLLDQFGDVLADALDRRDPSVLVRYVDELCRCAAAGSGAANDPRALQDGVALVVRTALRTLGVDVPPFR